MHLVVFLWSPVIISCLMLALCVYVNYSGVGRRQTKRNFHDALCEWQDGMQQRDILHLRARDLSHFSFSKKNCVEKK